MRRRFAALEQSDIGRVRAVAGLLESPGCLVRRLLAFFGEYLGRDCGHCGACAGNRPVVLTRPHAPGLAAFDFLTDELATLRAAHPAALAHPREVARFLGGLTSPALTAAKLTQHSRFGSLTAASFLEIVERVKSMLPAAG